MNDPITNGSYFDIINKIAHYLGSRVYYRYQKKTGRTYYLIEVSSIKQLQILIGYFEKNPLFSSKYLDYKAFYEVFQMVSNGTQYENDNIPIIIGLKNSMNKNRTDFNWDHLA